MKPTDSSPRDLEVVSAIVMPNHGESDDHVTDTLQELGAQVHRLAAGFLSVKASRKALRSVASMARVEEKTAKQMHS